MKKLRDPVSGVTHLIGAFLSLIGLIVLLYTAITKGSVLHLISFIIFGISLIFLYSASSIYHLVPGPDEVIKTLRKIDHMMIFILIAGSYTPFLLVALDGFWRWGMLTGIWLIAVSGVVFKAFWINAPRWLYTAIYLGMGWLALIVIVPLIRALPTGAIVWLFLGGAFYTIGAVFYALKWPNPIPKVFGFHEIWHIFVLLGSFSHFWSVYKYVSMIK